MSLIVQPLVDTPGIVEGEQPAANVFEKLMCCHNRGGEVERGTPALFKSYLLAQTLSYWDHSNGGTRTHEDLTHNKLFTSPVKQC